LHPFILASGLDPLSISTPRSRPVAVLHHVGADLIHTAAAELPVRGRGARPAVALAREHGRPPASPTGVEANPTPLPSRAAPTSAVAAELLHTRFLRRSRSSVGGQWAAPPMALQLIKLRFPRSYSKCGLIARFLCPPLAPMMSMEKLRWGGLIAGFTRNCGSCFPDARPQRRGDASLVAAVRG